MFNNFLAKFWIRLSHNLMSIQEFQPFNLLLDMLYALKRIKKVFFLSDHL